MKQSENYEAFKQIVDIQSFMEYFATEIYIGNRDWPDNNVQLWRTRENDGTKYGDTKWRWMLYDTEYSMNLYNQNIGNPIEHAREGSMEMAKLFQALCENTDFRNAFVEELMDLANNTFEPTSAIQKLDDMAAKYRPLMSQYFERFGGNGLSGFDNAINRMKQFISDRPEDMKTYIEESFSISVD